MNAQITRDDEGDIFYELKENALEQVLGKMHNMVGHAIIPFDVGGSVDMYYFLEHIKGTGFATMELIQEDGSGPKPNDVGTYELIAFTKERYNTTEDKKTSFNYMERRVQKIFTIIGNFGYEATLNPGDTCEIPVEGKDNICLVFDNYQPNEKKFTLAGKQHCLLLCIELFKPEMDFSRKNGSKALFEKLKAAGIYPYSDMDRQPVII